MALKECWECENPISTSAMSCPHCGAVIKTPPNPIWQFIGSIVSMFVWWIVLAFFLVVYLVGSSSK